MTTKKEMLIDRTELDEAILNSRFIYGKIEALRREGKEAESKAVFAESVHVSCRMHDIVNKMFPDEDEELEDYQIRLMVEIGGIALSPDQCFQYYEQVNKERIEKDFDKNYSVLNESIEETAIIERFEKLNEVEQISELPVEDKPIVYDTKMVFPTALKLWFQSKGGVTIYDKVGISPGEVFTATSTIVDQVAVAEGRTKKIAEQATIIELWNKRTDIGFDDVLVDKSIAYGGDRMIGSAWAQFAGRMKTNGYPLIYKKKTYEEAGSIVPHMETASIHREFLINHLPEIVKKYKLNDSHSTHLISNVFEYEYATDRAIRAKYWAYKFQNDPRWFDTGVYRSVCRKGFFD